MISLAQTPPTKVKKNFFCSKLHDANSRYRVWTTL